MEARPWHASYDPGVPASIDYDDVTISGMMRASADEFPDGMAIRYVNTKLTYRKLVDEVDRCAAGLAALGVEPGTKVAIHLPNLPQTIIAFHAVLSLGAVAVMTNPLYVAREIEHQWNDADCRVAITMDFLWRDRISGIRDRLPVQAYVIASIPEYLRFPLNRLAPLKLKRHDPPLIADVEEGDGLVRFRRMLDSAAGPPPRPDVSLDDVAALQYTGGTTGVSKGAMLTHGNLSAQTQQLRAWLPALERGSEVFLAALPFFHVFGLSVAMNLPVSVGATMVVLPNPREIPHMISSINKYGVTIFPIVPAMVAGINASPKAQALDVGTLKMCVSGSAPLPEATLRRFEELTGGKIVEGYGLTEASPVTHVNPHAGKRRVNTIGMPLPDTDCRIVSLEDGVTEVPLGEPGELLIRGPQIMAGYWGRPDETANTLHDGWLSTGDLATQDETGWFRIVGRKKEMIVAGGYNIYPDEVDQVLSAHPAVLECATIGLPDERLGETVKSFVVLRPGATADSDELRAHCREGLAAYKIPREIAFKDDLPKSSVLKILRRELRDEEMKERDGQPGGE